MTYQQPGGAYPGVPGIPSHPGGAGLPAKPPAPQAVQRAFYLMIAGAALSAVGVIIGFTQLGSIRSLLEKGLPNDDPDMINSLVTATIVAAIVVAVIEIGLWLWMAFACKAGKHYARVTGTVFFGVNAASTLFGTIAYLASSSNGTTSSTFASSDTVPGQILNWVTLLVGLAAVVLLWHKQSAPFFRPPQQFYPGPYGYAGYPGYGYPPGYGQPGSPQAGYGQPGYPGPQGAPMQGAYPGGPYPQQQAQPYPQQPQPPQAPPQPPADGQQ